MSFGSPMAAIRIDMACSALPEPFRVIDARGCEAMNALSRWEIAIVCAEPALDVDTAVGASATLQLVDEQEESARNVDLVVIDLAYEGQCPDGHRFSVSLAPPESLLMLRSGYRVFLDKTTKQIVSEVLSDAGIDAARVSFRLSGKYLPRPQCVQYEETEWAFVERLLADEGISYWFDFDENDKPLLVLADDPNAHRAVDGQREVPYEDVSGMVAFRHLFELEVIDALTPTAVHVRDFDVRAPDVPIEGKAGAGGLEHYEYPACVLTSEVAGARAKARLDQLSRLREHASAASNCIRLAPGRVLTVSGCSDDWMNRDYLVVSVEHQLRNAPIAGGGGDRGSYANRLLLVPWGATPFRPALPRAVPKVEGIETAITSGPPGQEIHVDDLGRVKVRFPWDRSGIMDDASSFWVRCLQMNMVGSMLLPRVGWEVPVAYIDGNPDQPFVIGRMYNATAVVPYGLPGASATSTFQSATSPGDGTTNEIRMGDSGGGQEMFIHASKDQAVIVGGSAKTQVSANETHDVKLALIADVKGSQSLTVGASQSIDVGGEFAIAVKGGRSETIGGMETIKVTANRKVSVGGAYLEFIGALYGIQCNQANTSVSGAYTNLIGGAMGLAGGLGVSETVVAARTELVAGSKSLVSAGGVSEAVTGIKSVTAGATSEKANGTVTTATKVAGSIKVGGSATMKAGGAFVIEAPSITIKAASLDAKQLTLSGGAVHVKDGTTKLKGTIHRKGGANLED